MELNKNFEFEQNSFSKEDIEGHVKELSRAFEPIPHKQILNSLLNHVQPVNYREKAGLKEETDKLQRKHFIVITVDVMLEMARIHNWKLCRHNGETFVFNGVFWKAIDREMLQATFGEAAEKMGVPRIDSRHYSVRREFILQFEAVSYLPAPERNTGTTLINLQNGTFEITEKEQTLRPPSPDDFLTYQLPFSFDENASAPLFKRYLDRVLPDKEKQAVIQEYLGYVFISPQVLKLEKVLLLVGSGANGKSVFIEIINALLGRDNVSSYSLQTLTESNGYTRAELATKLLNTSSEISGRVETNAFKLLASGEPIEARHIYSKPFIMEGYAKLLFATNELPKDVEQTNGYFRRWLILFFDVTIPENEQDKELAKKIIQNELSGVFNWVLEGLRRLLINKQFTECQAVTKKLDEFKTQSDSVLMFLEDERYTKSNTFKRPLKELFAEYRIYCADNGYRLCSLRTFSDRLKNSGYETKRESAGNIVFIEKKPCF